MGYRWPLREVDGSVSLIDLLPVDLMVIFLASVVRTGYFKRKDRTASLSASSRRSAAICFLRLCDCLDRMYTFLIYWNLLLWHLQIFTRSIKDSALPWSRSSHKLILLSELTCFVKYALYPAVSVSIASSCALYAASLHSRSKNLTKEVIDWQTRGKELCTCPCTCRTFNKKLMTFSAIYKMIRDISSHL